MQSNLKGKFQEPEILVITGREIITYTAGPGLTIGILYGAALLILPGAIPK